MSAFRTFKPPISICIILCVLYLFAYCASILSPKETFTFLLFLSLVFAQESKGRRLEISPCHWADPVYFVHQESQTSGNSLPYKLQQGQQGSEVF